MFAEDIAAAKLSTAICLHLEPWILIQTSSQPAWSISMRDLIIQMMKLDCSAYSKRGNVCKEDNAGSLPTSMGGQGQWVLAYAIGSSLADLACHHHCQDDYLTRS